MNARVERRDDADDLFCTKEMFRTVDGIPSVVECGAPAIAELDGGVMRCSECLEKTDFRPGEITMVYARTPLDDASMAIVHIRRAEVALSAVKRTKGAERLRHLLELHAFAYGALRFAQNAEAAPANACGSATGQEGTGGGG